MSATDRVSILFNQTAKNADREFREGRAKSVVWVSTTAILLGFGCSASIDDGANDRTEEVDATPAVLSTSAIVGGCQSHVCYGAKWIHSHPADCDDVNSSDGTPVTWDGQCSFDPINSFARLSNGWVPYFSGKGTCEVSIDTNGCGGVPASCRTRIFYGPSWFNVNPWYYDDVPGNVTWDGICYNDGINSYVRLSNGWVPYFHGLNSCDVSLLHSQCGGYYGQPSAPTYTNPVIDQDCADPGVTRDGNVYALACTGGWNSPFQLRSSTDLVHWTPLGPLFPQTFPNQWWHPNGNYWAPEIHKVGNTFVAYFTANRLDNGNFAIGTATASQLLGPYTPQTNPIVTDSTYGMIDAGAFEASDGTHYLFWKRDTPGDTPIYGAQLAADGLSLASAPKELMRNTRTSWEGDQAEGPEMVYHNGYYYLFYSGNYWNTTNYAEGVAYSTSPLGTFTKLTMPVVATNPGWDGPGHGSFVTTPGGGDLWHVYHAWHKGGAGQSPGRVLLLDRVVWSAWSGLANGPASVPSLAEGGPSWFGTFAPYSTTVAEAKGEFSGSQLGRWNYGVYTSGTTFSTASMTYRSETSMWLGDAAWSTPAINATAQHPACDGRPIVRRWNSTYAAGNILITGNFGGQDITCGDGTINKIYKNGALLAAPLTITQHGQVLSFAISTTAAAGDTLDFVTEVNGNCYCDMTSLDVKLSPR